MAVAGMRLDPVTAAVRFVRIPVRDGICKNVYVIQTVRLMGMPSIRIKSNYVLVHMFRIVRDAPFDFWGGA